MFYPIFVACIRATQPVYVRRGDKNSRKQTIYEIKRRANSGGKWPHIVIFPEGEAFAEFSGCRRLYPAMSLVDMSPSSFERSHDIGTQ